MLTKAFSLLWLQNLCYCWLVRVSLVITSGAPNILSQEMLRPFGNFMIIRPSVSRIHWLKFVYRINAVTSFWIYIMISSLLK